MESDSSSTTEQENEKPSTGQATPARGHRKTLSGTLLSKLSFSRSNSDHSNDAAPPSPEYTPGDDRISPVAPKKGVRAMAAAVHQQQTRRRKGSLRKAALLGRGAQREKKEARALPVDNVHLPTFAGGDMVQVSSDLAPRTNNFGLGISNTNPQSSSGGYSSQANNVLFPPISAAPIVTDDRNSIPPPPPATSPTLTYTSTTDEEDILSIPNHNLLPPRVGAMVSSGSGVYYPPRPGALMRRRSSQKPKSPLSIGLASSPLPDPDGEWDYSETERWGWVMLIVTWVVFVTGMGSCLGVWSWAWDVGETPYAPPELEDDPTLPIVGYYPALIILTAVMAWVWVVVAWVGMKYFRHAKISGD